MLSLSSWVISTSFMWSPSARSAFFPSSTYWVYASWILAVGINATVFPLNGEEIVFDRISATSAKDEHKKTLFIVLFCFDKYNCISSFAYNKLFELR